MTAARVRVYDNLASARRMRETFTKKPVREEVELPFTWPARLQRIGLSYGVAYNSDKWHKDGDFTLYKHLTERPDPEQSPHHVLAVPGSLVDYETKKPLATIGRTYDMSDVPMPKHFTVLALFEEINIRLYTRGDDDRPLLPNSKTDGFVSVWYAHAKLGGGEILWSKIDPSYHDQPFLCIYAKDGKGQYAKDALQMIVVGHDLDVEKDGIVG
jgi:hypothetical protein